MMPWKFCDDITNGQSYGVDRQTHKQTLLINNTILAAIAENISQDKT